MIRKWFKFNVSFIELLKNSSEHKNSEQRWSRENAYKFENHGGPRSLVKTAGNRSFTPLASASTSSINRQKRFSYSAPRERGDGSNLSDSEGSDNIPAEVPVRTEIFQIRGPHGSAFLVEVYAKDAKEVKRQLDRVKGEFFRFDKNILKWFSVACMLTAEPLKKVKDQARLAKIHSISSRSEGVHELCGTGRYLFISSLGEMTRVKKVLEKLEYKISGIVYKFQPSRKAYVEGHLLQMCEEFVRTVEELPKVLSVTHNI